MPTAYLSETVGFHAFLWCSKLQIRATCLSYPTIKSSKSKHPPGQHSRNGQFPRVTNSRALPNQSMGNSSHTLQIVPSRFGTWRHTHSSVSSNTLKTIAFSPDDRFLAIGGKDGKITISSLSCIAVSMLSHSIAVHVNKFLAPIILPTPHNPGTRHSY